LQGRFHGLFSCVFLVVQDHVGLSHMYHILFDFHLFFTLKQAHNLLKIQNTLKMIRNVQNKQPSLVMLQNTPPNMVFTMLIANKIRDNSSEIKDSGIINN